MNKSDLINALCRGNVLTKKEAESVVNICFNEMSAALTNGDRVEIRGLGVLTVRNYEAYNGRNPKTGEIIEVKPKKLPFFKCGKELKERVNRK
jgi:integration host factor subunit beta